MKRHSKRVWQIVSPTVRTKVARLWWNREETAAYLQELYERTVHSRLELQSGAAKVPGSARWADPRIEADTDLARVYAVAALCVKFNTYKEFEAALNRITVRHLASQLTGEPPWLPADLYQARNLVLAAPAAGGSVAVSLTAPRSYPGASTRPALCRSAKSPAS